MEDNKTLKVINLWGAPGSGKSTTAAGLFYLMNILGYKVELINEFAKELVWEERNNIFNDQLYITSNQNRKLWRLNGKVDYVITDSPLALASYYVPKDYLPSFTKVCFSQFEKYNNYNVFLVRKHEFESYGRLQKNEKEARQIEISLLDLLKEKNIDYDMMDANEKAPITILEKLIKSNFVETQGLTGEEIKNKINSEIHSFINRTNQFNFKFHFQKNNNKTKVINLWGAPGSGKSTTAAGLFYLMKLNKIKAELVMEYAKEKLWEDNYKMLDNQLSILSEQNRKLLPIINKVDFIITDSPLPLSSIYANQDYLDGFEELCMEQFNYYENINFLIERAHRFISWGRKHDEKESIFIHQKIAAFMDKHKIQHELIHSGPHLPQTLINTLVDCDIKQLPFLA